MLPAAGLAGVENASGCRISPRDDRQISFQCLERAINLTELPPFWHDIFVRYTQPADVAQW